jgi:RHS repeat-associated protein
VRFYDGKVLVPATDLSADGFGLGWGHRRTYSNVLATDAILYGLDNIGNGNLWFVENWPRLWGNGYLYAVLGDIDYVPWFKRNSDGTFTTLNGGLEVLTYDPVNDAYNMQDPQGNVTNFGSGGFFKKITDPGGNVTSVTSGTGSEIFEVQRSATVGGVVTTESFLYTVFTSGDNSGQLSNVLLRRQVGSAGWTNVRQVNYTYYGSSDPYSNGSQNDLQTAVTQQWNGSSWDTTGTTYYRYYLNGDPIGFIHGVKFVLNPQAYAALAAVTDPFAASDAEVSLYADYYFEYAGSQAATKEIVAAGSKTFTFSSTGRTQGFNDNNSWWTRTVETDPDGTTIIVYTNFIGLTMLKVRQSGSSNWYLYHRYDENGLVILTAESSAVTGYDDTYLDLLHLDPATGKYQYLADSSGLIHRYVYYSTTGSGAAAGYLQYEQVQEGQTGTVINVRQLQYTSHSNGTFTVYPVSAEITCPSDTDQTITIEKFYSYAFFAGSNQVQQKTSTWPSIATSQNGSGSANSRVEVFDVYGNRIWLKDERGFITYDAYDVATGATTQHIDDVDTSLMSNVPTGWSTPTGGGLHLVTDYEIDPFGRTIQELDPPRTIDVAGTATTVRSATWTVYDDVNLQIRVGQGYATGTSPSYTYTLINPVAITTYDLNQNVLETIQATRASTSGALLPTDAFAQTSYVRWTTNHYTDCCLLASTRNYFLIPSPGSGTSGVNYNETDFGYDVMGRRNRIVTPGGTITRIVFDPRGLPLSVWVGTNDTGATATNPAGSGAPNNMVPVTGNVYDGGSAGGDGNVTQQTQYVDASGTNDRATGFGYDSRNRLTSIDGEVDFYKAMSYDNLDRLVQIERYNTTSSGNLVARSVTNFDDMSRVYQSISYAVDPSTGSVGNGLTDNIWYDPAGNVLKQQPAGSQVFNKFTYDGLNRQMVRYTGYNLSDSTYADAGTISGNTILQQVEMGYASIGNVIQTATRQRYHNATGTGALSSPSGTQPKARVTCAAAWQDGIDRLVATAAYGTNGGTALSRPSTIPAPSDTCLVATTAFNSRGEAYLITDPAGTATCQEFDDAGRRIELIENYQAGSSSSSSSSSGGCAPSDDVNRTTAFGYTADDLLESLTAQNATTGDQTTTYVYGSTLTESAVASSLLKRYEIYPDSVSGSDQVAYTYNRQAQPTTVTDQNGTVHNLDYDLLGRPAADRITTLGSGVDNAVLRIGKTYEVRGMVQNVTSYSNATVGSGSVVNDVQRVYNNFGQLSNEYQAHGGAVNTSTSPQCQYAYADGSANHARLTSMTYPNGRVLNDNYGTSNSMADATSRIASLIDNDGTTHLADYSYLGLGSVIEVDETQPGLSFTLIGTAGGNDPDTGDIYRGLDRFGRVKDLVWWNSGTSANAVRIQHGYDRAGNRLWRADLVAEATSAGFDELYAYDKLYRVANLQRGTLNSGDNGITAPTFGQCWTLDATGNWKGFREDDSGSGTWDLVQSRTANTVNEITGISNTTGSAWVIPAYDGNGNMNTIPQPESPTLGCLGTYDAWNRLVKLVDTTSDQTIEEYAYDGLRRRTVKQNPGEEETRDYYYSSAWQVLEERVGGSPDAERQFAWGLRYIDDLILRDRDTNGDGTLDERMFALQDPNWNVVGLTDSSGNMQERYAYDAYGLPTVLTATYGSRSSSSYAWETLYAGYRYDAATGLYLARRRPYNARIGVWCQRDPVGVRGGINLAEYAFSRAPNAADPFGDEIVTNWTDAGGIEPAQRQLIDDRLQQDFRDIANATPANSLCRKLALEALNSPKRIMVNWDTSISGPAVYRHTDPEQMKSGMRLDPTLGNYLRPTTPGSPNFLNNRPMPTAQFPRADAWIVLIHELGHQLPQLQLTDPTIPGNPAGVNLILENTCRSELGIPPRGGYPNVAGIPTRPCYGTRTMPNCTRIEARPGELTPRELKEAQAQLDRLRKFYKEPSPYDNSPESRSVLPDFSNDPTARSDYNWLVP